MEVKSEEQTRKLAKLRSEEVTKEETEKKVVNKRTRKEGDKEMKLEN